MIGGISAWLDSLPLLTLSLFLMASVLLAAGAGFALRIWRKRDTAAIVEAAKRQNQESCIVSGLLGLLTLLLAFTFSLTVDRFEIRRELVIADSNAIGTAYLRAQLLPEPHRTRLSGLLLDYTRNMLLLGRARRDEVPSLLAHDDRLLSDIWSATVAAYDVTKALPSTISFLDSMNTMIDADASRRQQRLARVPDRVLAALFLYLVIMGAVFGYVLSGKRTRLVAAILMSLLIVSFLLIIDFDQPTSGRMVESQASMEAVLGMLENRPPGSYDRWRNRGD